MGIEGVPSVERSGLRVQILSDGIHVRCYGAVQDDVLAEDAVLVQRYPGEHKPDEEAKTQKCEGFVREKPFGFFFVSMEAVIDTVADFAQDIKPYAPYISQVLAVVKAIQGMISAYSQLREKVYINYQN